MELDIVKKKKAWLRRYIKNCEKVDRLKDKISMLDNRLLSSHTSNLSGMPRGSTPITSEDIIADKMELETRIKKLEKKGREYRREISRIINDMDDGRHADILEARFISGVNVEDIAEELGYTVRHIYRLYSEALERIYIPGL